MILFVNWSMIESNVLANIGIVLLNKDLVSERVYVEKKGAFETLTNASLDPKDNRIYFLGLSAHRAGEIIDAGYYYILHLEQYPDDLRSRLGLLKLFSSHCEGQASHFMPLDIDCNMLLFHACNVSEHLVFSQARKAFTENRYSDAQAWYQCGGYNDRSFPIADQFLQSVIYILQERDLPLNINNANAVDFVDLPKSSDVRVNGRNLRWLWHDEYWGVDYGDFLDGIPSTSLTAGVMWWNGKAVLLLREKSNQQQRYEVKIQIMHRSLQTGSITIMKNNQDPVGFSINNIWQELPVSFVALPGYNILTIEYLEDVGDVFIDWIEISPILNNNSQK